MDEILEFVLAHWPFISAMLIFAVIGQVAKGAVWTMKKAAKSAFYWWGRKTMALHPVVAGVLLGITPGIPASAGADSIAAKALYFAAAGVMSTWGFAIVKGIAKKRGIDLAIPGASKPPPTP